MPIRPGVDMWALRPEAWRRSLAGVRSLRFIAVATVVLALVLTGLAGAQTPARLRARHVLVAWKGAKRAGPLVTRTKDDARRRATELLSRAKSGFPLDELAREATDDPAGVERGGDLGAVPPGTLVPELEAAILAVKPGVLVTELVESPFGFHVVQRLADVEPLVLRQLVVAWTGAPRAAHTVKRTKDEARAEAEKLRAQALAGVAFETLLAASDDAGTKARGGLLGELKPGAVLPAIEQAGRALQVGEVSAIVETPFGFHVLQRMAALPAEGAAASER